jgi:polyisoprenyl-teichoic acid--peptidoglycan teichoic acid transferase
MRLRRERVTAHELARELGVPPRELRRWLRAELPRPAAERGRPWLLTRRQAKAARRHFRPPRRRPRVALILASLVSLLAVAGAGIAAAAYWQAEAFVSEFQADEKRDVVEAAKEELNVAPRRPALPPEPDPQLPRTGRPVLHPDPEVAKTILLVGSDGRWDAPRNRRSDTIILARFDPAEQRIALLSVPRDLRVDIPGYRRDRVNMAYKRGGIALLTQTLRETLGVEINHFFAVDMRGFRQVVATLGGVYLPIDGRYFNRNVGTPGTNYADIDLRPGYQRLDGEQALSFVRFRHADSDLLRAARQQLFLREAARQVVESRIDVLKLRRILRGVAEATASDVDDLGTLWRLLRHAEATPSNRVARYTVPAREQVIGGAFYVTAGQDAIRRTVLAWYGVGEDAPAPAAASAGAPAGPSAPVQPRAIQAGLVPDGGRGRALAAAVRNVPLCRPTALPSGFRWPSSDVIHTYRLSGHPAAALWATRGSGRSILWTATTWSDAPVLRRPSSTIEREGRTYELWFENRRLRQVAWKQGEVSLWITNTLGNELSIEAMLQLADSCR